MHDGHIHTPFCPHGTADNLESYIHTAKERDAQSLTFTEHAPLPRTFDDPVPGKDSGMASEQLHPYLQAVTAAKEKWKNDIEIKVGLEVDYIHGYEAETKALLDEAGPYLDDAVLSVHFLPLNDRFHCIDFSPESFGEIVKEAGSLQAVYALYFEQVKQSIQADLGTYKPDRIGHMTLVRKFQKRFPRDFSDEIWQFEVLDLVLQYGMSLDINTAGRYKPDCGEMYPPGKTAETAARMGIPLVYGSDAHASKQVCAELAETVSHLQAFER
ncbi:histidinol-phosphatase [Alkalicoccus urumqiensis]|uniref:Histidinol-phosphatase n=1 Tax=Alkalicoccus urumqiensis TaxID=1548213 RepID=A0A2P6MD86_ALKUR|nr:histidinol-phosphatase [Alkalicoccus urumqiensis]